MSVNIKKWKMISILFSLVVGTLLHFTYQWSGENAFVGLFSAVNESTWEHLKLAFFPMLFMAIVGYFLFTFSPPQIALFQDPVTGTYGIENRRSV